MEIKKGSVEYWENFLNEKRPQETAAQGKQLPKDSVEYWENFLNENEPTHEEDFEILNPEEITDPITIAKTSYMLRPATQIKAYAKARKLSPDKYFVHNGEILFKQNGKVYRETTSGFWPKTYKFGVEMLTDPATYLGVGVGSVARRAGTRFVKTALLETAGGAAGEALKQGASKAAFDEKVSDDERLMNVGISGVLGGTISGAALGAKQLGGAITNSTLGTLLGTPSQKVTKMLSKSGIFSGKSLNKLSSVQKMAKDYGIALNVGEASNNSTLKRWITELNKSGEAASEFQASDIARSAKLSEDIPVFLQKFFPDWIKGSGENLSLKTPPARSVREAVKDELAGLDTQRTKLINPFYKRAFENNPEVDTSEIIKFIDSLVKNSPRSKMAPLNTIKNDLFEKVVTEKGAEEFIPIISLKKLDEVKKILNRKIKNANLEDSDTKSIISEMRKIRAALIEQAEEISPEYKTARDLYTVLTTGEEGIKKTGITPSPEVKEPLLESFKQTGQKRLRTIENIAPLSKIGDSDLQAIGGYILASEKSSPQVVQQVKEAVLKTQDGKQIWENTIADYVSYTASKINVKPVGMQNLGGKLWSALLGTNRKKELLKTALDPVVYHNFYTYMDILRRTGLTPATQTVSGAGEAASGFKSAFLRIWKPLVTPEALASDRIQDWIAQKGIRQLTSILNNPDATKKLSAIKNLHNTSEIVDGLVSFMSWGAAQQAKKAYMTPQPSQADIMSARALPTL